MRWVWIGLMLGGLACGPAIQPPVDAGFDAGMDAGADAGTDAGVDGGKAAACAAAFGSGLIASFGRFDGIVSAVVRPVDTQCAGVNSDHVVVQVWTDGGVFRMVVNVKSDFGVPDVRFAVVRAPLTGGAWAEGWHPGANVDYPTTLGMHTDAGFTPIAIGPLVERVTDELTIGQRISVFAESSGGAMYSDSAHKVHRNGGGRDGALVLDPESADTRWLLFHFANQTF